MRAAGSATGGRAACRAAAALLLALAFPCASARASDNAVELLSLDDVRRIAAENNRDVRKAAELRSSLEGRYVEERAAALPQVTIAGDLVRSRDEGQKAFGGTPGIDTREVRAELSQPLYTWGQVGAAIRAARVGLATADDRLRVSRQAAVRDASVAFHDILLARELSAIAARTRDQRARHLDEARRRHAAGTATDYDVLVAEVAMRNAEPDILRTENLIRSSRDRLRFLLGRDGREVDVRGSLDGEPSDIPPHEEALATAWKRRPELHDLRHRIGISEELWAIARAGDKPRLDLQAGLGWKDVDAGMSAEGGTWSAGLFARWPIFDGWRARGRAAQARSDRASLGIEEARLLEAIALEVRDAVNAVREAGGIVAALSGTEEQARRLLSLAEKGYEYGVKTRLEVEDAQLNLTQASGSLARARRDLLVARVNLDHAMGTIGEPEESRAAAGEKTWRPADSPIGIVKEVLSGEPRLVR